MTFKSLGVAFAALAVSLGACAEEVVEAVTVPNVTVEQAQADAANWRPVDPANLFIFETNKGRILIEAFPDVAPKHYAQFAAIIRSGDYDGTVFHRVIDGFMAQGGDVFLAKGRESGLPDVEGEFTFKRDPNERPLDAWIGPRDSAPAGYLSGFPIMTQPYFLSEMSADGQVETYIPHCRGVVSTARTSDPNSANSQFFLMRDYAGHLDRQYTAWGRIVEGIDVALALKHGPESANGNVRQPDILMKAKVAADLPESERPVVFVRRTDSEAFKAELAEKGEPHVCDLPAVATSVAN